MKDAEITAILHGKRPAEPAPEPAPAPAVAPPFMSVTSGPYGIVALTQEGLAYLYEVSDCAAYTTGWKALRSLSICTQCGEARSEAHSGLSCPSSPP